MRLIVLCSLVMLVMGCSQGSGTAPTVQTEAGEGLNQLRDLLVEATTSGPPPRRKTDLTEYEGRYPAAVAGVNDGSLTVIWGKGIREGIGEDAAVIAHQAKPAADGVWVVLENSELKKLTTEEFQSKTGK